MLISKNLHKKSSEVSIKTKSTPASLSFTGQVTKHITVKWIIGDTVRKSNQINSDQNRRLDFEEGKARVPGEKPIGAEQETNKLKQVCESDPGHIREL